MAQDKRQDNDHLSAADKALLRFTELMIDKIQTLQGDWKKPWFTPGATQPRTCPDAITTAAIP